MIQVWLHPRVIWADRIIRDYCPQVELILDLEQIKLNTSSLKIVIDVVQSNQCCSIEEILEYNKIFDRIVLINAETRLNILEMITQFDLPKVHFLSTGCLKYTPQQMTIKNLETTTFGEVRRAYHKNEYKGLEELKPMQSKNLYFDALLGFPKEHRDFVDKKVQDNYQDKIFKRYMKRLQSLDKLISTGQFHWPIGATVIPSDAVEHNWHISALVQFGNTNTNAGCVVPVDIYNDTCYSIVTETFYSSDFVMLTEKTAKPLIARRLFVMFAGVGYLAHLHRQGFQTFNNVIDESYDLEPDNKTRWSQAFKQVEYLCNQPQQEILQKIQPILEYNYNLFVSRDWSAEFEQAIVTAVTEF